MSASKFKLWVVGAAAATAAYLAWMLTAIGGHTLTVLVDDWGEMVVAALAAGLCLLAARSSSGPVRRGWLLMGAACAVWSAGEVVWAYNETVAHLARLFPSPADIGFVLAVPLQIAAVLHFGAGSAGARRLQVVMDGLIISAALFYISWVTVLHAVYQAGADSPFSLTLSLAYPVGDVISTVIVLSVVANTRRVSGPLIFVALGVLALAFSDSAFAYLSAITNFPTNPMNTGWVAGFLLVGLGAIRATHSSDLEKPARLSRFRVLLPYLVLAIATSLGVAEAVRGERPDGVAIVTATALVLLIMARQMTSLIQVVDLSRKLENSIGALREREEALEHQAFHDPLTNLANRALFSNRVRHALARFRGEPASVAVLFLDMDDFKTINDSLGHDAGDRVIWSAAERLRACVRPGDTIARLGGDEFAVLLEDVEDAEAAIAVAKRMLDAFRNPFQLDREVFVNVSVGIAMPQPGGSMDGLVRNADVAMYAAKAAGKGRFAVYEPGLESPNGDRLELRTALYRAVSDGGLVVHYQPIYDLAGGTPAGAEALVRWRRGRELLHPRVLLPLAEEAGLMSALGRHVLQQACADLAVWNRERGDRALFVTVNVSGGQLTHPGFATDVRQAIATSGIQPHQLVLEMLGDIFGRDAKVVVDVMAELTSLGVRLGIDDFGSGHASLARLRDHRPWLLKLDHNLTAGVAETTTSAVVESILDLCRRLGVVSVAEAVERPAQLEALRARGCNLAQGNLLQAPVRPETVRKLMVSRPAEDRVARALIAHPAPAPSV